MEGERREKDGERGGEEGEEGRWRGGGRGGGRGKVSTLLLIKSRNREGHR